MIKTTTIAKGDVFWKDIEKYYHLLRYDIQSNGELFIRPFPSNIRKDIWTDGEMKRIPDHISYHKDGTIHIKHKGGEKSEVPFKLQTSILEIPGLIDLPFLAISYYKNRFGMYKKFLTKVRKKDTLGGAILAKDSFTVVFFIKDETKKPLEKRSIIIKWYYGGMPIDKKDIRLPKLKEGDKVSPIINICLNPKWELLKNLNISDIFIEKRV